MNSSQQNYTTTDKELLSIVANLKEFHNILLGHQITVYTDHKNLTYKQFNTERVMRWRLILEEFVPELKYIKEENNVVADALSCLEMSDNQEILNISELYGYDDKDLPDSAYPIFYHDIAKAQETATKLQQKLVSHKYYTLHNFSGGDKDHRLIFRNNKICLPAALQKTTVDWYHEMLCHPGETRIEHTLRQQRSMDRHPSRNHICRPRNLSHNTIGIPDAASIWTRRHLKHQACCRLGTHLATQTIANQSQ